MGFFSRWFGRRTSDSRPPPAPAIGDAVPASFPYPVTFVHGAEAVVSWRRLQTEWRKEGASAVVLGDAEDLKIRAELLASDPTRVADLLRPEVVKTATAFFSERQAEYTESELDLEIGEWPARNVPPSPLTAHTFISSGKPKPQIGIAKIPTSRPWEIPAYLKAGGWNDCPSVEDQAAVLRYWHEKHGAEIYSITGDVLECIVSRPPATREEALALAREQFLFCSDIVHQGTETIEVLAATLLNSDVWFFWWD